MPNSFSPEDRDRVQRWLGHGAELALELKQERATHRDVIWCLLCEAVDVVDRLPDQEKRWLSSGTRSGGWNMVGLTYAELMELERIRLLSAMKPYDGVTRVAPQSNDVDRALGVMSWLNWCNAARLPHRLKRAAVALARGGESDIVHRIYCPTRKPNRQNINEIKVRTVGFITNGLKKYYGLVPGDFLSFTEDPSWTRTFTTA